MIRKLTPRQGLPNTRFFPFETLEAQSAKPERWQPTPNRPGDKNNKNNKKDAEPAHITVPTVSGESNPMKKVDVATALQYGQANGYPPLLDWVRQFTRDHLHPDAPYSGGPDVILTCGSTDGFAKTLEMFVNPWIEGLNDPRERPGLLCETFVYGNILSQAEPKGVQIVPVKADEKGMLADGPGGLEDVLKNWDSSKGQRPHLMYTVTLGHNPTGFVIPLFRRKEIYAICSRYDVIIVEDEPYWYLQFPSATKANITRSGGRNPEPEVSKRTVSTGYPFLDSLTPSYISIDVDGRVVRLDTFSKTIAPGCRLGWITAQPALIDKFTRIAETSTQQPSGFVQSLVAELVMGPQPEASSSSSSSTTPTSSSGWSLFRDSTPSVPQPSKGTPTGQGWQMSGWIRWLEGLRGMYERRMNRMCTILDSGSSLISSSTRLRPTSTSNATPGDWDVITTTPLFTYSWPEGGMFIWLRMHFESHPLWQHPLFFSKTGEGEKTRVIDGPMLSLAMMLFLTLKPHLVLVSGGNMFSATPEIKEEIGWQYFRLCFAAVEEEDVDEGARRFVDGVKAFWKITDARVIEKLVDELSKVDTEEVMASVIGQEGASNLGGWLGC
ncbi:pyridoxal phosphate-dependent transferase [Sordaria brevicollis]|uniref:Pyridoxal phosphate-dependent transferase n=1 Tax=Sordaria brevicollis TaxID=83679 RepID=A0AAE0UHZ6_SORBR|nr:pyridoxal phosphate-dependent transferase [Sordaria brevicollis]